LVSGDEINGFSIGLDINWKAKTYKGETYDKFIIEKHRAEVIAK